MRSQATRSKWGRPRNGKSGAPASANGAPKGNAGSAEKSGGNGSDAKQRFERYTAMAKAAASSGDAVESEKYYQYADHFLRQMKTAR